MYGLGEELKNSFGGRKKARFFSLPLKYCKNMAIKIFYKHKYLSGLVKIFMGFVDTDSCVWLQMRCGWMIWAKAPEKISRKGLFWLKWQGNMQKRVFSVRQTQLLSWFMVDGALMDDSCLGDFCYILNISYNQLSFLFAFMDGNYTTQADIFHYYNYIVSYLHSLATFYCVF